MKKALYSLDDVMPFLQGVKRKNNGEIVATCPVCGKESHFYLKQNGDKLVMYCQKCQLKFIDYIKALENQGLQRRVIEDIDYNATAPTEDYYHIYTLPNGKEQFRKRRQKWRDGHKSFTFEYVDDEGQRHFKKPDNAVMLYNLDRLENAEPSSTLYIVEGEKCVDAMTAHGLLATTARTGSQKHIAFTDTDKKALQKFENKVIIPDNDKKGGEYALAFADYDCKILNLANVWEKCPRKGDIADYFKQGGDVDAIKNYKFPATLNKEYIDSLDAYTIVSNEFISQIFTAPPAKRQEIINIATIKARSLKCVTAFKSALKSYKAQNAATLIVENETEFTDQPMALRCGKWTANDNGIYRVKQRGENIFNEYASTLPIMPVEILENLETGTERIKLSYLVKYKNGNKWREKVFPRNVLSNKTKIVELSDYGIDASTSNAAALVDYIRDVITLNQDRLPRINAVSHLGWCGADFLPYTSDIMLDNEEDAGEIINAVTSRGTLAEWVEYVRPLWEKNLYLRLTIAASFASVLIAKVHALPFVFHLWGGTGTGKTVAMMLAASVWGNPRQSKLVLTLNMTPNALMQTAGVLYNLPLFGDELQTIKENYASYDKLIMQLTEGTNRGRLDSNARIRKQKPWKNAFIFTGEEPITQYNSGGGVKNRVIELECTEKLVENGNAVVNFVAEHYGTAGKAFVDYIKENSNSIAEEYNETFRLLQDLSNSSEKQISAMALIALADMYVCKSIFKIEHVKTALSLETLAALLKTKEEIDAAERAYTYIMDVIGVNADKFDTGIPSKDRMDYPIYWGRINSTGIKINKTVLTQELQRQGFSFDAVKKKWADSGKLILNSQGRYFSNGSLRNIRTNYVTISQV